VIMQEEEIRESLNKALAGAGAGDANAEHQLYDEHASCEHRPSGERILGRNDLQALRSHHPGMPSSFNVKRFSAFNHLHLWTESSCAK